MNEIAIFGSSDLAVELYLDLDSYGKRVSIYERTQSLVDRLLEKGIQAKQVSYQNDHSLTELGVGGSLEYLFAFLNQDSDNVFLCLSARTLCKRLKIMAVANQPEVKERLLLAGADRVVEPYLFASDQLYQTLSRPLMVQTLDETLFGQQDLQLEEIRLHHHSTLVNKKVGAFIDEITDAILIGGRFQQIGEKLSFGAVDHDIVLRVSDILVVVGSKKALNRIKSDYS